MRFAYIDSQGKEVNIPSVDALRLRIELGAIVDGTMFHDSNTGKWAPAQEHEIYRTLQRELQDLDAGGFVPPPPVPRESDPEVASVPEPPPPPAPEPPPPPAPEPPAPEPPEPTPPPEPEDRTPPPIPETELDMDTLGAQEPEEEPEDAVPPAAESDDEFGLGIDLGLAPPPEPATEPEEGEEPAEPTLADGAAAAPAPEEQEPEEEEDEELPLSSEWGEDEADDEEEATPAPSEASEAEAPRMTPMQDVLESMGNLPPEVADPPPAEVEEAATEVGKLRLEPTLEDSYDMEAAAPEMAFETPLSDFDEDAPPSWMQEEKPGDWADAGTEEDEADFPPPQERAPEPPPVAPRPRPRSAPPPRRLTRASTPGAGRVVGLVLLAVALFAGGWYGWMAVSGGIGGGAEEGPPLPEIPTQLVPQMRQYAAAAVDDMVGELAVLPAREAIPPAPDQEWLAGAYLAGASGFPGVPGYWNGVLDYLEAVEARDDELFQASFEARIQEASLTGTNAGLIRERGNAGWAAAAPERQLVYDQLRAVATASLNLHDFLLQNEALIDYEPAAGGVSRDPVLEAVPVNEALGVAMWDRVGAITGALDNLGFLETISTDGLLNAFLEKLEATPIR